MKKLYGTEDIILKLGAGYSLFYCQTYEILKSLDEIKNAFNEQEKYTIKIWDFETDPDPSTVINDLASLPKNSVVIAKNFNWFLKDQFEINKPFVTYLQNNVEIFSSTEGRKALIVLSDEDFEKAIPSVLQKDFTQIKFQLPNVKEIEKILMDLIDCLKDNPKFTTPTKDEIEAMISEVKGLTKREIVNAFAYSLKAGNGKFDLDILSSIKADTIEKTAGLKIGNFKTTFENIRGYENIKNYTRITARNPMAKGILLLGPAGVGKTVFCQALANEIGKKMIIMEMAELFGSLVGQSEQMMKNALDIIKANDSCLLMLDEVEKGLAGVGKSQEGDGGTTKRSMAQFLKFLSDDRPEGVYIVATCNDISSLPPEWLRSERWDGIFFIDLPNEEERKSILDYYKKIYNVEGKTPDMSGWSGAEIKTLCRQAKMLNTNLLMASQFVIPISKTMGPQIESLRKWAEGKTIPASVQVVKNGKVKTNREIEI